MATITPATFEDIPELAELLRLLFIQEHDFVADKARQEGGLYQIINSPQTGIIFVARSDNAEIVGMVMLLYTISTVEGGPVGLLEDMMVRPDQRDIEIGKELLSAAIDHALSRGLLRLTLLTDPDNAGAHRFYARHGFVKSSMTVMRLVLPGGTVPSYPTV
jgi:ribosomal protein S18 acetylase RimI-like enzyme